MLDILANWTVRGAWFVAGVFYAIHSCHASPHMRIEPCPSVRDYHQCAIITITGEITVADDVEFAARTKDIINARVDLSGPGGSMIAGIDIGEIVHAKGFNTAVPAGTQCRSTCANIWVAGKVREMGPGSALGWHAVFKTDDPSNADGMGNAMVGMYLAHLGFNYGDVLKLFGHSPNDMHATFMDADGVETRQDLKVAQ